MGELFRFPREDFRYGNVHASAVIVFPVNRSNMIRFPTIPRSLRPGHSFAPAHFHPQS
jgi:hypothetical protein